MCCRLLAFFAVADAGNKARASVSKSKPSTKRLLVAGVAALAALGAFVASSSVGPRGASLVIDGADAPNDAFPWAELELKTLGDHGQ